MAGDIVRRLVAGNSGAATQKRSRDGNGSSMPCRPGRALNVSPTRWTSRPRSSPLMGWELAILSKERWVSGAPILFVSFMGSLHNTVEDQFGVVYRVVQTVPGVARCGTSSSPVRHAREEASDPLARVSKGSGVPTSECGVRILGTPLDKEDYVQAHLTRTLVQHNVLLSRVPPVSVVSVSALALGARANYLLKVVRPDLVRRFAAGRN